jgi:hypothetical protein
MYIVYIALAQCKTPHIKQEIKMNKSYRFLDKKNGFLHGYFVIIIISLMCPI